MILIGVENQLIFTSATPRAMQTAPTDTRLLNRKSLIAQIQPLEGIHNHKILYHVLE